MASSRKGWLTPDSGATEYECRPVFIPLDTDLSYMAAVNGALNDLTKAENWEQFGSVTPEEAAEVMLEMYTRYTEEECCEAPPDCGPCEIDIGDPELGIDGPIRIIRRNPGTGHTEQLDDGVWTTPTDEYEVPPIPTRTGGTLEDRLCLASANAANVMADLYEEVTDQIAIDTAPAAVFSVIYGAAIAILGAFAGPTAAAYASLGRTAFDTFVDTAEILGSDVWDADFTDEFVCLLLTYAQDDGAGVITFEFPQLREAVTTNFGEAVVGLDADRALLWSQVGYLLDILAAGGVDTAGATTAITTYDCGDCFNWCYYETFGNPLVKWTRLGGTYTTGVGIVGVNLGANSKSAAWMELVFPADTYVTQFMVQYDKTSSSGANNVSNFRWYKDGVEIGSNNANPIGLNNQKVSTVNAIIDRIYIDINSGSGNGPVIIEYTTVEGPGGSPFGIDNCP